MSKRSQFAGLARSGLFAIGLASIVALPSQAQVLEEIVVTAQKREQNLQEVPISVTAYSGEQLRDMRITNTDDVVDYTPGLTMFSPLGEGNTPNFSLRGVSGSDISTLTEAPIAVYTDEIYYGTQFGAIAQIYDMERYEALRGPQGTLFGRNATGGLLHFVTQKPVFGETTGYGEFTLGSNNETTFEGAFNAPLGDDWAVRISGAMEKYDGYVTNRVAGQADPNNTDKVAGRLQLGYNGERSRLNFNFHYAKDDSRVGSWQIVGAEVIDGGGNVIVPAQDSTGQTVVASDGQGLLFDPIDVDPVTTELLNPQMLTGAAFTAFAESIAIQGVDTRRAPNNPINFGLFGGPYIDTDGDPYAGDYNYIADLNIENTGAWLRYEYDISDSMTLIALGGTEEFKQSYLEDTDLSSVDDIRAYFAGENQQNSLELRLEGSTDRLANYVVGAYYYDRDVTDDAGPNVVLPTLINNIGINPPMASDDDGNTESIAIFGQVDVALNDKWTLTAGARYTDEETTVTTGLGNVDFCLFANVDQATCAAARAVAFPGLTLADQGVIIDIEAFQTTLPTPTNSFSFFTGYTVPNYTQQTNRLTDSFATGVLKLAYAINEDSMVYGSYSQGSKSGGFNTNPDAIAILGTDTYSREQLNSIEFGYRSEFADGRMRFNASVFDYDYEDYQAAQFLAPGIAGTINTGAEITGMEMEFWAAPADNWTIFLASAILFDTEVANITDTLGLTKSREMKQAPDLQLNGYIQ
jgi:iron complex outermembrane receptor protein